MTDYLSPFAEIIESTTHRHARTLRTSFLQKLWDTFFVLGGRPLYLGFKSHAGIFDCLTLYLPFALLLLSEWCITQNKLNYLAPPLVVIAFIINTPFLIARFLFSMLVGLVTLPIVALVHGVSAYLAKESTLLAFNLMGALSDGTEQKLEHYLTQHSLSIEELDVTIEALPRDDAAPLALDKNYLSTPYQLLFWQKKRHPALACEACLNNEECPH